MSKSQSRYKSRRKIIYDSPDEEKKNSNKNEVQVLNNIISLNHRPITILVPNEQIKPEATTSVCSPTQKIPRPANAFMIFANENRKKVAKDFPQESNKEISCRLGMQWKNLSSKDKEKYFSMAKLLDADHKRKYPDYVYNPKEARIRKAMRERERSMGAAQMGSARSRRPNWPKTPIHMAGPGPAPHPDHLLGTPSKELCSALRAEMEHGFLAGNGGYVYPSQQYQFSPQSDYATYIQVAPGLSSWVQNQYNMQQQGNTLAQQQIWNQYQTERLRAQQTGSSYLMNPQSQTQDYQHVDHMPPSNMMQMGPTTSMKSSMHQNLDNAASDVERYMNIPRTMSSNPNPTSNEVRTQQLQPVENPTPRSVASSTPIPAAVDAADVANGTNGADAAVPDVIVNGGQDNNTPAELNISNVTAMSEVDAQINNMETTGSGSDANFGGFGLLDDSSLSNIGSDIHKAKTKLNPEAIPPAHSNFRKVENDPLQPMFPMDFVPGRSLFLPQNNNFIMDHFIPDLSNPFQDPGNMINKPEFPVDFSAQKYYESVANGNFDGPLSGEPFGNFICDDGYNFLTFTNSQDNPTTFPSNQFESTQYLNDPNEIKLVGGENNFILDLSKVPQNEEQIDVGVEKNTTEKLAEVSNKICDELSKIV